jgi:hypothetical protein
MSNLMDYNTAREQLPSVFIDVKYQRPGNVVEYERIEFDLLNSKTLFKAIPLLSMHARLLTGLPGELMFEVKDGKVNNYTRGKEDVVKNLVNELVKLDIIEMPNKICVYDCYGCAPKVCDH